MPLYSGGGSIQAESSISTILTRMSWSTSLSYSTAPCMTTPTRPPPSELDTEREGARACVHIQCQGRRTRAASPPSYQGEPSQKTVRTDSQPHPLTTSISRLLERTSFQGRKVETLGRPVPTDCSAQERRTTGLANPPPERNASMTCICGMETPWCHALRNVNPKRGFVLGCQGRWRRLRRPNLVLLQGHALTCKRVLPQPP